MPKWVILSHPSQGHTVTILALEQPSIHRADRLYPCVIPSLIFFFVSVKRVTRMVCNGKGCLHSSQNVTACKNFTSQTCAAEVFRPANLRTRKHQRARPANIYPPLELPKQTSHGFARSTGSCSWNPSTRVRDELMESGVAITQSATHGDCHGTAAEQCKAPAQTHSRCNLRESGGGKRWEFHDEETEKSHLGCIKCRYLIIKKKKSRGVRSMTQRTLPWDMTINILWKRKKKQQ